MTIYIDESNGHEIEVSCGIVEEDGSVTYWDSTVVNSYSGSVVNVKTILDRIRYWFKWQVSCGSVVFYEIYDIDDHKYLYEDEEGL